MIRRGGAQLVGFLLVPLLSALAPLVAVPVIARVHGAAGWGAIAIGIALGNACAVTADLGWTVVGPQRLARRIADARSIHATALTSRAAALVLLLPIVAAAAWSLAPADASAASATATGIGLTALSPAWFFTGLGRPWTLMAVETVPKCIANVAVAAAIAAHAPLVVHGSALGIAALVSALAGAVSASRLDGTGRTSIQEVVAALHGLRVIAVGRAVSTTSTVLPTLVIGLVAPALVPTFAALDRLVRMGLQVLSAVPAQMQSWLGVADTAIRCRRVQSAIAINTALGFVAGFALLVLVPVVLPILFGPTLTVPDTSVLMAAGLVAVICTSRGLGLAVVAEGRSTATTWTAVVIAVVGIVGVGLGTPLSGAAGAFAGLLLAETAGLVPPVVTLLRARETNTCRT
jgi:O-antigen/teichoic acid export membrane protein